MVCNLVYPLSAVTYFHLRLVVFKCLDVCVAIDSDCVRNYVFIDGKGI